MNPEDPSLEFTPTLGPNVYETVPTVVGSQGKSMSAIRF